MTFLGDSTTKKKKGRGPTRLKEIHDRTYDQRKEVEVNEFGQPVGDDKICSEFSQFLGTCVRKPDFLPLTCKNWREVPDENKEEIWVYANVSFTFQCVNLQFM